MTQREDGLLIVDKPVGMTSFDVVREVRKLADIRKVGHAGTLDPKASGVLAVAVGQCTRLLRYMETDHKAYEFILRLGEGTPTLDTESEVDERGPVDHIDRQKVEDIVPEFVGHIDQVPPIHSAIKVDGERAYELARAGEDVDLDARGVDIRDLELVAWESPDVRMKVRCGSGMYVRALARDISRRLDTVGHTTMIRRREVGAFSLQEAVDIRELDDEELVPAMLSPLEMVRGLDRYEVDDDERTDIQHGRPLMVAGDSWELGQWVAGHDRQGRLLAVMECTEVNSDTAQLWPRRVMIAR